MKSILLLAVLTVFLCGHLVDMAPQTDGPDPHIGNVYVARHCNSDADCPAGTICIYPGSNAQNSVEKKCVLCACTGDPLHGNCTGGGQNEPINGNNIPCSCFEGWQGVGCDIDINECSDDQICTSTGSYCVNSPGSFSCECCDGFVQNGTDCQLIDECATNNGGCSAFADCTDLDPTCDAQGRTDGNFLSCACWNGYVGDGLFCSASIVGTPCNNTCLTANSICFMGMCECQMGFRYVGGECVQDANVDGNCTCNDQCIDDGSYCGANGKCVCIDERYWNGTACVLDLDNGQPCTDDDECSNLLTCINDMCGCVPPSVPTVDNRNCIILIKTLGQDCVHVVDTTMKRFDTCADGLKCNDSKICVCDGSSTYGAECESSLGEDCECNSQCTDNGTYCGSDDTCICTGDLYNNGTHCVQDVDECADQINDVCNGTNGYCVNNDGSYQCKCCDGFLKDNSLCIPKDNCSTVPDRCDGNATCTDLIPSCSATGVSGAFFDCKCNDGYFGNGYQCFASILHGRCGNNNICLPTNSQCDGGTCQCSSGYFPVHGECVEEAHVTENCSCNAQCVDAESYCGANGKCVCKDERYWNDTACVPDLAADGTCRDTTWCRNNLVCINNSCGCEAPFSEVANYCVYVVEYNGFCNNNDDCSHLPNTECITDSGCSAGGTCRCSDGFYLDEDQCECKARVGFEGTCNTTTECVEIFECILGQCICPTPSVYNVTLQQCIRNNPKLNEPCVCGDICEPIDIAVCNTTSGFCVCANGTALVLNSSTNKLECIAVTGSFDSPCQAAYDCDYDQLLKCLGDQGNKKCKCKPNETFNLTLKQCE